MLSGTTVTIWGTLSVESAQHAICAAWPQAVFEADEMQPSTFFVYENQKIKDIVGDEGVTPEVDESFVLVRMYSESLSVAASREEHPVIQALKAATETRAHA